MGDYKAIGLISTTGQVSPASLGPVAMKSESAIELETGFEVILGQEFDAVIESPCVD